MTGKCSPLASSPMLDSDPSSELISDCFTALLVKVCPRLMHVDLDISADNRWAFHTLSLHYNYVLKLESVFKTERLPILLIIIIMH